MDLRTVVTISALLLMTAESNAQINGTNTPEISSPTETSITRTCPCPSDTSAQTTPSSRSSTPVLVHLTVKWTKTCEGNVEMLYYPSNSTPTPVCYSSKANISSLLSKVCEMRKGCENKLLLKENENEHDGYDIAGKGVEKTIRCTTLKAHCAASKKHDTADVQGQLRAYKVVTALLCCVLVVLFLIRFTRPTVKALQKRLSDRRQNRWIGPTQSHSVSYHRGKTAVKNNEGEKRLSYPALERLTVSDSREPSSNRNSDYNL